MTEQLQTTTAHVGLDLGEESKSVVSFEWAEWWNSKPGKSQGYHFDHLTDKEARWGFHRGEDGEISLWADEDKNVGTVYVHLSPEQALDLSKRLMLLGLTIIAERLDALN